MIKHVHGNEGGFGLGFVGVGSQTKVKNITIKGCRNDCLRVEGGTVNIDGIVVDNAGDDLIDVKYEYLGRLSNIVSPTGTYGDKALSMVHLTTKLVGWKFKFSEPKNLNFKTNWP